MFWTAILQILRKIMLLGISEYLIELLRGDPADLQFRLHHIKGVDIRVINIHFCRDARTVQAFNIAKRFRVKRFPVSNERIGRRQTGKVLRPCGSGIGGHVGLWSSAEIELPGKVVFPGVPDLPVPNRFTRSIVRDIWTISFIPAIYPLP